MSRSPIAARCGLLVLAGVTSACVPTEQPTPPLPAVFVTRVHNDHGATERLLFGTVRPRVETELGFRAGGRVAVRWVALGQTVRAGQTLARVDTTDYQLAQQAADHQQRAAQVDAAQTQSDAARLQRLLADGVVTGADAERQQARADAAAARWGQAQRQSGLARNRVADAALTAPFDGIVTALRFEAGQTVSDGQGVLTLARTDDLEVEVDVPEALAGGLQGWRASARVDADGLEAVLPLRLRELAPAAAAVSRTHRARFALDGPQHTRLRMGASVVVSLAQAQQAMAAALPVGALLVTGATDDAAPPGPSVWRVDAKSGALQRTAVQLLSQSTDSVRVGGLPDGALIVSVGAQKLDSGMKVRPVQRPMQRPVAAAP